MKKVRYESLLPLPPIGSTWVANAGINFSGVVMTKSHGRLHQYDEDEIAFMNGSYCTVLESWHKDRRCGMVTVILPSLLKFTLSIENEWESYGWERV